MSLRTDGQTQHVPCLRPTPILPTPFIIMANVLQPNISFHPRPVSHAPSPLGFGFGLNAPGPSSMSTTPAWGSTQPGHTNPAAFHQLASSIAQSASSSKSQKRKLEVDDEVENIRYPTARDHSMDRSPTPERPKRAAPKRAKIVNADTSIQKDDMKERKNVEVADESVDIGVLLGKSLVGFCRRYSTQASSS